MTVFFSPFPTIVPTGVPVDWNHDGDFNDTGVIADINKDGKLTILHVHDRLGMRGPASRMGQPTTPSSRSVAATPPIGKPYPSWPSGNTTTCFWAPGKAATFTA
jgi:hypothetical protein